MGSNPSDSDLSTFKKVFEDRERNSIPTEGIHKLLEFALNSNYIQRDIIQSH